MYKSKIRQINKIIYAAGTCFERKAKPKKIGVDISEQVVEKEIVKEGLQKENHTKSKDVAVKSELKKEKLKTKKK